MSAWCSTFDQGRSLEQSKFFFLWIISFFIRIFFLKFFILIHFFPRVIHITQMSHSPPQVDWLIQFSVGCEWVYSLFGLSTWRTVFRLENSLFFPEKWSKLRITQNFNVLRIVTYRIYLHEAGVRLVFLQVKSNNFFLFLKFFVNFYFPNFETLLPELFGIRAVTDTRDPQTKHILIILNRTKNKILVVGSVDPYVTRIIVWLDLVFTF